MNKSRPQVIVCDPEASNTSYYSELIQQQGASCLAMTSAADLLQQVETCKPALIIVDSALEEPDSYQVLNLLRANRQCHHIPLIFVTQNLSEGKMRLHDEFFELVTTMPKPLDSARLVSYLQHYLRQYEYRLEVEALYSNQQGSNQQADMAANPDEGIVALSHSGQILYANRATEVLLRTPSIQLVGSYVESLFEEPCKGVRSDWQQHPIAQVTGSDQILQVDRARFWRGDGVSIDTKFAAVPFESDSGISLLLAFKQLKESRESKDTIAKLSRFDHLTNLPMRGFIEEYIDRTVVKAGLTGVYFAVLSVDLDHFRYINESMGHDGGDRLLKSVADRIQNLIRRDDQVARMEGDEFVVVLSQIDAPENAGMVANKIIERIRETFLINGHEVFVGCSIGVAVYPTCGDDATTLMKNAEAALARAKAIGRNHYQYYTVEMNKLRVEQMQLEYELHQAVEQKQWRIQYLPVTGRDDTDVVACEVRLTWMHPRKGELALESFLVHAEDAGLAAHLFRWLWQQALERFDQLPLTSKGKVRLIMPVSPVLLLQDGGVEWVIEAIAGVGLGSHQIYVQIPESYYSARHGQQSDVLNELCRNGFNLILDNFGTGFAPLNLLKEVPYSLVKLSESFVAACGVSKTDQAIIKGVVDMVHELGIKVLAGSVDDADQKAFLESVCCDWISGDIIDQELEQAPHKLEDMGIFVFPG